MSASKTPIPSSPEELAEILMDDKRREEIFSDAEQTKDFLNAYAKAANKGDFAKQVAEQASQTVIEMLKDSGIEGRLPQDQLDEIVNKVTTPEGGGWFKNRALYNPQAMGAALDKEFRSAADFFKAIWHGNDGRPGVEALRTKIRNAFSSAEPSGGGFLIPEVLRSELLRVAAETGIARSRSRVIPMDSLRVPFPAIDETSHASSLFGGIVGYWTEEGAALTESQAAFGRVVLEAKKLTAYTEVPNELLSDSAISFEAFIGDIFPEALAWYEDLAFLRGTGAGEPLGVLNGSGVISVAKETGQGADTIVWENLVKMYSRMLPGSQGRAVWLMAHDTFPELATMALSVGTGGSAIWLNNGVEGPPATILGRPVLFSEKIDKLGDGADVNFVDFGYYLIGDRQAMSVTSSPHFKFSTDKTAFKIIERVDGRPWLNSAITPYNGGATISPYVSLAERA